MTKNIVPILQTRVNEHLTVRHDLAGDAAEAQSHLDLRLPRVLMLLPPLVRRDQV